MSESSQAAGRSSDEGRLAADSASRGRSTRRRLIPPAATATVLITAAFAALIAFRVLLFQSFVIPSTSMEPTLRVGDRVVVWRWDTRNGDVRRGDVIVFDGEGVFEDQAPRVTGLAALGRSLASALGAPIGEHDYVKRVVGLPGDRVTCCTSDGRLTINGRALPEPYLPSDTAPSVMRFDIVVPPGRYFVMGDNRLASGDSRAHLGDPGGGTVPLDHVVGRVVMVYWPWSTHRSIDRVTDPIAKGSTG